VEVVVQTEKLTKFYGPHRGIAEVDLAVNQSEVFGFLGPNGAGKTTTIRLLLGPVRRCRGWWHADRCVAIREARPRLGPDSASDSTRRK